MIIVGVLLAILAAAIGTTSKQLIAASVHLKKKWLFHLGAGMNIAFGPVVDASAYAFAPQVIIAPFACLDVIFNALTAPYTLHWQNEKLTKAHILGTALVAVGAVFTSVFAVPDNKVLTVQELEAQLFFRPTSLCYLLTEAVAILFVHFLLKRKLLSPKFRGISFGVVAGALMGNVFFLKGLIGIITMTVSTGSFEAWLRPTPYILTAFAVGGAVTGHIFMRKGLGEYKGVFMVTIFEGAHITAACLSGCIVMEEMVGAPQWRYICYWIAVSSIVAGMLVINKAAADAQIEGKFHIAQSFAEVSQDEQRTPSLGIPVGRSLETLEEREVDGVERQHADIDLEDKNTDSPWPSKKFVDEELSDVAGQFGDSPPLSAVKNCTENVESGGQCCFPVMAVTASSLTRAK